MPTPHMVEPTVRITSFQERANRGARRVDAPERLFMYTAFSLIAVFILMKHECRCREALQEGALS